MPFQVELDFRYLCGNGIRAALRSGTAFTSDTTTYSIKVAAVGANGAVDGAATQRVTVGGESVADTTVWAAVRNLVRK